MSGQLQSVELFAGGGGMALGMRAAGFEHQALVEWWAPGARVLRHNAELKPELWKPDRVVENDVREVVDALADVAPVQLVAGGPPCQPFSLAGAHAGHSDERNMFPTALDVIRRLRPEFVVFENVPGLLRPSFAPYVDYVKDQLRFIQLEPVEGELWHEHHARLLHSGSEERYRVYQEEIDAADLGVPQCRSRVFIVAIRHDVDGADTWSVPQRTHSRDVLLHQQWVTGAYWDRHQLPRPAEVPIRLRGHVARIQRTGIDRTRAAWRTLRDTLVDIPDPGVDKAPEGWPNHVAIPGARTYRKHTGSPLDLPSKTIKAGVHGVAGGEAMLRELDGTVRYLTIREAAIVQGFPFDYEFPGVRSRVMGVIGNAVAVDVAASIGRSIRDHSGM
jgi:DNA (cytosine-5)-methyltransferase 1